MSTKGLVKSGRSGQVEYTARAFDQDATEAMKGDIIRGLIETITNSDDAYQGDKGKIRIEVEHKRGDWKVVTRDRACGMRVDRMIEVFTTLGGRTSGFESGADVRGNLGRGAKDLAAFGEVEFESVRDGVYSRLVLRSDGSYESDPERTATPEIRDRLGVSRNGSGTSVTIHCRGVRCPQHRTFKERLQKHFQLRDILSHPNREVLLVDLGSNGQQETLRYTYPQLETVFAEELEVPGYEGATANITIYRNADRYDDPSTEAGRPAGLLIKGRRAIYENTLFSLERNPHAGWFSGRVECPAIDDIAREYDERRERNERHPETNSIPIITRRRDGLEPGHPFYKALASVVEEHLGRLVREEEERARQDAGRESAAMRKALDALGRNLAKLIDEDLKEADEEEGLFGADDGEGTAQPLQIIPERAVLYMGEDKTLSLLVRADLPEAELAVDIDPQGVVEHIDDMPIPLEPHKKRADVRVARLRLRPLVDGGETILTVRYGDELAYALIEVREEREIEEIERPAPEGLEFERDSYRVRHGSTKTIELCASLAAVDAHGATVTVESSDAGVVVLGQKTELTFNEEFEFYTGTIKVDARALGARATLTATMGTETAACQVIVTSDGDGPGLRIRVVPEAMGDNRSVREEEGGVTVIKVLGGHPALKRYLGRQRRDGSGFEGEDEVVTKALIAEIVAERATRIVMEKKTRLFGEFGEMDAAAFYAEHTSLLSRYLKRCHRALVVESRG